MNAIQIDLNTLLVVTIANITALAIVSPAVMGWKISVAARSAQLSLFFYAISWIPMILSNLWPGTLADRFLSTISVGGFAASNWMLFKAMSHWLGPRRFERTVKLLIYLIPVGYCILFDNYSIRVGWANFLLAIQMFLLAFACFRPAKSVHGDWRLVVAFSMCAMAILTLGRGLLGAFTDSYPSFLTPHPWNVIAMFMTSLLPLMVNYALLGGWHEEAEIAMHDQAITDAMTGLYNRRGWVEIGQPLVANANRQNDAIAIVQMEERLLGSNDIVLDSKNMELQIAPGGKAVNIVDLKSGGSKVQEVKRTINSTFFSETSIEGQDKITAETFFKKTETDTITLGLDINNQSDFGLALPTAPIAHKL